MTTTTELIAGLTAGSASTLVMHPLDVIKVKLQVTPSSGDRHRLYSEIVKLLFQEGDASRKLQFAQIYRGLAINMIGNGISWGLYFMINRELLQLQSHYKSPNNYFSSALVAGLTTSFITNPIWVLKTRILSTRAGQGSYSSIRASVNYVYSQNGLRGFWSGFVPGLFGIGQATVQFSLYQMVRDARLKRQRGQSSATHLSAAEYLALSAGSKIVATIIFYPYQVVRASLQVDHLALSLQHYTSTLHAIRGLYHSEGFLGFYKGLGANLVRVVPATCITFFIYEKMKHVLEK